MTQSDILLVIAASAWVDAVRSSLGAPDMMMTMFMESVLPRGFSIGSPSGAAASRPASRRAHSGRRGSQSGGTS